MDIRCDHDPKVLKCSGVPLCKNCVSEYRDKAKEHVIASLAYIPNPRPDKFLGSCIEKEQKSTSEMLEYLEQVEEKLRNFVILKISDIKDKVTKKSCLQNQFIQEVKRHWDRNPEEAQMEVDAIKTYGPANVLTINEKVIEDALDGFYNYSGHSYRKPERMRSGHSSREDVKPERMRQDSFVDFLDSHTVRRLDVTKSPVISTYYEITGEFALFPESRYCFVDDRSIVCTGGVENGMPMSNSYLVTLIEKNHVVAGIGKMLQYLCSPRSKHAICSFSVSHDSRSVFLFGGGVNQSSAEKLNLSLEFLANAGNENKPQIADEVGMEWKECKQMPYPLETAACVSHYEKIYITGSHRTELMQIMQYDQGSDNYETFSLKNDVMRYPCVLSCWHTLITIIYSDGEGHWMYDWPIGSMVASEQANPLSVKTDNIVWAPVCPPITIDSKCYILIETDVRTVLACYSFIKKQVTFPQVSSS